MLRKGNQLYAIIVEIVGKHMGKVSDNFVSKQLNFINKTPDNLDVEDLPVLAEKIRENSVILIGKNRADIIYTKIMGIYNARKGG